MIDLIISSLPYLIQGLGITIVLAVCMLTLGFVVGLGLALMEVYGRFGLPLLATLFERLFRAIPAIVLLFLFYYGLSDLFNISSFTAAVLALGLRTSAYQSQIFRGALLSVPRGQMLAARSIGLSQAQGIINVVIPQALRQAIGPWTNEALSELKDTSLAFTVGVVELMRHASYIVSSNYGHALPIYISVAVLYLIVSLLMSFGLTTLKRKMALPGFENT